MMGQDGASSFSDCFSNINLLWWKAVSPATRSGHLPWTSGKGQIQRQFP